VKRVLNTETEAFPAGGEEGPMNKIAGFSGKNILLNAGMK
jgi:hypothetical protein